jgi:hypothetical protein
LEAATMDLGSMLARRHSLSTVETHAGGGIVSDMLLLISPALSAVLEVCLTMMSLDKPSKRQLCARSAMIFDTEAVVHGWRKVKNRWEVREVEL